MPSLFVASPRHQIEEVYLTRELDAHQYQERYVYNPPMLYDNILGQNMRVIEEGFR